MTVHETAGQQKERLRAHLLAARRNRPAVQLTEARAAVARQVLDTVDGRGWRQVAAYEPMRTEPGSVALLTGLRLRGLRVLVPVTLPDSDLDWRLWGTDETLGTMAVADCDAVLCPALAVDRSGARLGRGGGSYDRALQRTTEATRIALLFDGEVLDEIPAQSWDQPVDAAVTPSGWVPLASRELPPADDGNGRVARED